MFKRISATALMLVSLAVCCAFTRSAQEPGKAKVMDYPNVFHGREPIKITDLGGYTFEVKNVSNQAITKFTLHFVTGQKGMPLHGEGAHQHILPVLWGYDEERLLQTGETIKLSIEENIKPISKDPGVDLANTEIWAFEAHFEDSSKMWRMGKFLKKLGKGWEEDVSLNPLNPVSPQIITGRCWQYDNRREWPKNFCTGAECTACKFASPQFQQVQGGYKLVLTCVFCENEIGSTCQKSSGFACGQPGVQNLDFGSPCE